MATVGCVLLRFDADLARVQEETKLERNLKEKAIREKDLSVTERIHLEQELEVGPNITIYTRIILWICCITSKLRGVNTQLGFAMWFN